MIAGLLGRIGLGIIVPYLAQMVLGGLVVGGGATAWFLGWSDWQTAGLLVVCLVLLGLMSTSDSKLMRIAMAGVIGVTLYAKGRIDEGSTHDAEMDTQARGYQAEIKKLKDGFALVLKDETDRQKAIAQKAMEDATTAKAEYDQAKVALRFELDKVKEEAKNAADANDIVFDADDIAALNRLRYDPKRKGAGRPVRGVKAKNRRGSQLDVTPVSSAAKVSGFYHVEGKGKGGLRQGREVVRAVPPKAPALGQVHQGKGQSINWRWFQ